MLFRQCPDWLLSMLSVWLREGVSSSSSLNVGLKGGGRKPGW